MHERLEKRRRVTMIYRKLISALVFVVFGFCFAEAARAQSCDPNAGDFDPTFCDPNNPQCSLACWIFGCPNCNMGSTTGSSVDCKLQAGGSNVLNRNAATFAEITKADCTHTDSTGTTLPVTCDFELVMSGVTLSACTPSGSNSSIRATGLCQDNGLTVAGKLTCPVGSPICAGNNPCIMNFGIDGVARNKTQCENVFPADILPAGQVLDVTVTREGSTCDGAFVDISEIRKRWCNSGDFANSPVDCTPPSAVTRRSGEVATSAVPFTFDVQQTVNTSPTNCKGGKSIDKGGATVHIFGS